MANNLTWLNAQAYQKLYKHAKGGFVTRKSLTKDLFSRKSKIFEQISCATPVPVAYKKGGKRRITGEYVIHLIC